MNETAIINDLEHLYDLRMAIRAKEQEMLLYLPPGFWEALEGLRQQERELAEKIRKDALGTLQPGQSICGAGLKVTVSTRASWDDKVLLRFAKQYPEITVARKETVYASISEVNKKCNSQNT